jgi:hypothetical protein
MLYTVCRHSEIMHKSALRTSAASRGVRLVPYRAKGPSDRAPHVESVWRWMPYPQSPSGGIREAGLKIASLSFGAGLLFAPLRLPRDLSRRGDRGGFP